MRLGSWLGVVAVMAIGGLAGWLTRAERARPPLAPAAASEPHLPVRSDEPTAARDFIGVVLTGQDVDISPRVEGRLLAVRVKPGDRVRKSQVVAEMDVKAVRQSLRLAEAALDDAEQRLARRTAMVAGVLSQEEIANARAVALERRAHVAELRAEVEDATVRAPFDGAVGARFLEAGAIAGPTHPIVRLVGASQDLRVRFAIPEELAGTVTVGARARLSAKSLPNPLPMIVENVAPEVDSAARMIFAVARLETGTRAAAPLPAGMVARVVVSDPPNERGGR
jgi:RND family efflux transporter MFP subunit